MPLEQKQIPVSHNVFDWDDRTDGPADYIVTSSNWCWHNEPLLLCMIPLYILHKGNRNSRIPLWRMNGAGPTDSKIPVILCYGYFSCRFGMDYGIQADWYSLARFLANRGKDVWIIELQQALEESSKDYIDWLDYKNFPWKEWYKTYLFTTDAAEYSFFYDYFNAQDICSTQTAIVLTDDEFTATVDDAIFEDVPAIISAVLHITGQTQVQWVGHSMGATIIYGFMPTQFTSTGKLSAGYLPGPGWLNLPPNSILSLTALNAPTALIDCPAWLLAFKASGDLNRAYTYRGKLPRYFNYQRQSPPRWPIKLQGVMDTSLMKQLDLAITYRYFSFFNPTTYPQQYYHLLYEGQTLPYAWPLWTQFLVRGHTVSTPVSILYDGNGYDDLATWANVSFMPEKLQGYHSYKPFFQYHHSRTCHAEMINGYNVEDGSPTWPKNLNYTFGGTYHFIWYDLNRYLPPATFSAYITDIICSGAPLISWHNLRDAVSYEIWTKQGASSFTKKMSGVNSVLSAVHCTDLSSGVWQIKVRAISLGGSWQDHSGASSAGSSDDPSLYLSATIT